MRGKTEDFGTQDARAEAAWDGETFGRPTSGAGPFELCGLIYHGGTEEQPEVTEEGNQGLGPKHGCPCLSP